MPTVSHLLANQSLFVSLHFYFDARIANLIKFSSFQEFVDCFLMTMDLMMLRVLHFSKKFSTYV
jgi:hypothetical protein